MIPFPRAWPFSRIPYAGPGTELAYILAWTVAVQLYDSNCHCDQLREQMDTWGPDECERRRDPEIVPALLKNEQLLRGSIRRLIRILPESSDVAIATAAVDTAIARSRLRKIR